MVYIIKKNITMRISIIFYVYNEIRIFFEYIVFFKGFLKIRMIWMLWWAPSDRGAKVSMGHFKEKLKCRHFGALFSKTFFW